MTQLSRTAVNLCWFFIAVTFLINVDTLYDGHNWGGDFAQYILSAQNMLEGRPYNDHILLNMTITYPPGFPFLLMPLIKIFGINLKVFKLLNILFWYLSIVCSYHLLKREIGRDIAVLTCVLFSISTEFFIFKQNVLSDIPFFFFTLLVFYLFFIYEALDKRTFTRSLYFVAFMLCLSFSLLIRTAGVITFASFIFYFIYMGKKKEAGMIGVFFLLTLFFQFSITGVLPGKLTDTLSDPQGFLTRLLTNSHMVWNTLFLFFIIPFDSVGAAIYKIFSTIIVYVSPLLFGGILGVFFYRWFKKTLKFFHVYVLFYISTLLFMYGFPNSPLGTVRFTFPLIIPLIIWSAYEGRAILRSHGEKFGKVLLLLLIFINIYNIRLKYDFNDDVWALQENREVIAWIKENIKDNESYILWQALPMALFTGKVGMPTVWVANPNDLANFYKNVKQYRIKYLILTDGPDSELIKFYKANPQIAKLVWENNMYHSFKLSVL